MANIQNRFRNKFVFMQLIRQVIPPALLNLSRNIIFSLKARRYSVKNPDVSIPSDVQRTVEHLAVKHRLVQTRYFSKREEWSNESLYASGYNSADPVPDFLFPWHAPFLEFMKDKPRSSEILDICCGIPTLLLQLKVMGFDRLSGTDDETFQPRIVRAAEAFSRTFDLNATIHNIRTGYPLDYRLINKKFDVISQFGAATYTYLTLIDPILKLGG